MIDLNKIKNYIDEIDYMYQSSKAVIYDIYDLFDSFKSSIDIYNQYRSNSAISNQVIHRSNLFKIYQYHKGTYKQLHNTYITNVNLYLFPEPIDFKEDIDPFWTVFNPETKSLAYKTANIQDYYDEFGKDRNAAEFFEPLVKLICDVINKNTMWFVTGQKSGLDVTRQPELVEYIINSEWVQTRYSSSSEELVNELVTLVEFDVKKQPYIDKDKINTNTKLTTYFNNIVYENTSQIVPDPTLKNDVDEIIKNVESIINKIKEQGRESYIRILRLQTLYETLYQNINGLSYKIRDILYSVSSAELSGFSRLLSSTAPDTLKKLKLYNLWPNKKLSKNHTNEKEIYIDVYGLNHVAQENDAEVFQYGYNTIDETLIYNYDITRIDDDRLDWFLNDNNIESISYETLNSLPSLSDSSVNLIVQLEREPGKILLNGYMFKPVNIYDLPKIQIHDAVIFNTKITIGFRNMINQALNPSGYNLLQQKINTIKEKLESINNTILKSEERIMSNNTPILINPTKSIEFDSNTYFKLNYDILSYDNDIINGTKTAGIDDIDNIYINEKQNITLNYFPVFMHPNGANFYEYIRHYFLLPEDEPTDESQEVSEQLLLLDSTINKYLKKDGLSESGDYTFKGNENGLVSNQTSQWDRSMKNGIAWKDDRVKNLDAPKNPFSAQTVNKQDR